MSFSVVALDRVKNSLNLGQAMRAAGAFGADLVVASGRRCKPGATDTGNAYRQVPFLHLAHILDGVPFRATPVVIERCSQATSLESFIHPDRAYYIFGPEDGAVLPQVIATCRHVVKINAASLNLAACVSIVLYDRQQKGSYHAPSAS